MLVLNKDVLFHWDLVGRNLVTGIRRGLLLKIFCTKIGHYDYLQFKIQKQSLLKIPRFEY
jgi:hypothetical protein